MSAPLNPMPELQVAPFPQGFSDVLEATTAPTLLRRNRSLIDWALRSSQLRRFVFGVGSGLLPWLVPLSLMAVWQMASANGWLSTRVLPAPLDVLKAAFELASSGELAKHVQISAWRALSGLAIGGGLGLLLGLLTGSVKLFETLLDSSVQMVRNIPALSLIPLVILWFGIEETSKLFLIAVSVFFPIYLNTFHGIRNVDPALVEMGRSNPAKGDA